MLCERERNFLEMSELYRIIPFDVKHGNCGGSLVQFQMGEEQENALPFEVGKVLVSWDMKPDDVRGNHAHYETEEIVVALSGGCTFELDDGCGTIEQVRLSASSENRGRKTEDGRRRTEDRGLRTEDRGLRTEDGETGADIKDALLLYPHVWRTFYDFEPGTVLLVVANIKYDEADYIRRRTDFEEQAKQWKTLGGSSSQNVQ